MKLYPILTLAALLLAMNVASAHGTDTLPALKDGKALQTVEEMWAGFDPRSEPLDVEVLKEWEQDGVVLKVLRYRVGVFKGQIAMMAAVYGCPKGGSTLPGLVQIHGGGQYADYLSPLTNAKRGYATISIAWAGRIAAPNHQVNPDVVKLFWEGKTNDPNYRLTTDWGALDGYHSPTRNPGSDFNGIAPAAWTLDAVASPRNSPWFLSALAVRRALTFLEQQPEVDASRLGVYGHSMGGKLTVMTAAADARVKAAAPSCGGMSDRSNASPLYRATIGDDASLRRVTCPIMFLSPANDFHGRINDLQTAVKEIKSADWRVTCSAHHNHQDNAECEVATQLWFDQVLMKTFTTPKTPKASLELKTQSGVPYFTVKPDAAKPVQSVDIFYTQQGQMDGQSDDTKNTVNRFWHHATATKQGDAWTAEMPVFSTDRPLWVYANVRYPLDKPVAGVGYYYRAYTATNFNLSSLMHVATAADLKAAGVKATLQPSLVIETFAGDWQKEWFTYKPETWARSTHKLYDPQWRAPASAQLALDVRAVQPNKLVVGLDEYAAEVSLTGGAEWQRVVLSHADFRDAEGNGLAGWAGLKALRLGAQETLRSKNADAKPVVLGGDWKGDAPEFRKLRWEVAGDSNQPAVLPAAAPKRTRPNIIVLLTDDQGYGDFSCHGNPILKTPQLDRLHDEGVRFTAFHVSPTCSPTRSALLSGRHEFKNGVTHTILERERMSLATVTLAQALQSAGYATGIFGKWHLGDEAAYQPERRGFDEVFIHGGGGIGQSYPGSCGDVPGNKYFDPVIKHNGRFEKTSGFCTDVFTTQALKWIESVKDTKPFFCFIPFNAAHAPLSCPPQFKKPYEGKVPDKVATFYGMIANIDENVGRLMAKLKAWGMDTNTLVVFMNDNGGDALTSKIYNAGMRGSKATAWEGGTRAASFWRWPGTLKPATVEQLTSVGDLFPTFAELAGATLDAKMKAQVEGRNLMPLLENPQAPWPDRNLITHVGRWGGMSPGAAPEKFIKDGCAIRNSRFSLVRGATDWQLFDLQNDPGQTSDIAARQPDVVKALSAAYDQWWAEVLPCLVNEDAYKTAPKVNPFKEEYSKQSVGGRKRGAN